MANVKDEMTITFNENQIKFLMDLFKEVKEVKALLKEWKINNMDDGK